MCWPPLKSPKSWDPSWLERERERKREGAGDAVAMSAPGRLHGEAAWRPRSLTGVSTQKGLWSQILGHRCPIGCRLLYVAGELAARQKQSPVWSPGLQQRGS